MKIFKRKSTIVTIVFVAIVIVLLAFTIKECDVNTVNIHLSDVNIESIDNGKCVVMNGLIKFNK